MDIGGDIGADGFVEEFGAVEDGVQEGEGGVEGGVGRLVLRGALTGQQTQQEAEYDEIFTKLRQREVILANNAKNPYFCRPIYGNPLLPNSIMVVQKILDLSVLVRIQVGQQV